jgi:hypothetical protein
MISKPALFLLVLAGFIFLSLCFLSRPGFFEFDSYYYLNLACGHDVYGSGAADGTDLAKLLPCNEFLLKVGILILYALTLSSIYFIGKLWFKEGYSALLLVLTCFTTPILLFSTIKLENDIIGIAFSFLALLFYFAFKKYQDKLYLFGGAAAFALGFIIWKGTGLVLLAIMANEITLFIAIPLTIIALLTYFRALDASEGMFMWGFMFLYLYSLFFSYKALLSQIKENKWAIPFLIIGIFNPKFFFFNVLFLGKLMIPTLNTRKIAFLIGGMLIWSLTFSGIALFESAPKEIQKQAVQETIQYAKDQNLPISNDFEYGHLIYYYGSKTPDVFGVYADKDFFHLKNQVVLTVRPIKCQLIKTWDTTFFGEDLKLFKC